VPEQQVAATLRLMGREPNAPITADVGKEVCQRDGAKALLGGTIAMLGSSYVITLNAQDCVEGRVFAEAQAQAPTKEAVLGAMGTAVSAFREKLGESLASIQKYDTKIEEATTRSLEALKAYSQGLRTRRTTGDFDSVPFLRRAIDLDPDFALAYARLGTVYSNLNQFDESKKMTTRAYELRQKVSESERLYIEARYYTTVEQNLQKAIDTYNVWLATYPNEYTALTNSGLLYKSLGNRDEAIKKLELATKVAPDQPLAFTNLGQTYFELARYEDAKRVYETAVKLNDSTSARIGLFQTAVMMGDTALAEQQVTAVRGRRDEVEMTAIRMFAATYRGRMNEAGTLATDMQTHAIALSRAKQAGTAVMEVAISEAIVGLGDRARQRVEQAEADGILSDQTVDDQLVVAAVTRDAARARQLLPRALEVARQNPPTPPATVAEAEHVLEGLVKLAEGKPADAATLMEPITFDASRTDVASIWTIAKMQAGDPQSALKGFQFLTSNQARNGISSQLPYAYAMLARTQAQLGQKEEARKSYQKFFDLFKDADPDLPLLVQAREEFSKLGS
jgi:tetratricopeptide (TPR) repeat protein